MSSSLYVVLSMCLTYGIPLALAVRALLLLRRDGGKWRPGPAPDRDPMPHLSGGSRPLPACLTVPPRAPSGHTRVRAPERV